MISYVHFTSTIEHYRVNLELQKIVTLYWDLWPCIGMRLIGTHDLVLASSCDVVQPKSNTGATLNCKILPPCIGTYTEPNTGNTLYWMVIFSKQIRNEHLELEWYPDMFSPCIGLDIPTFRQYKVNLYWKKIKWPILCFYSKMLWHPIQCTMPGFGGRELVKM